ncbi:putative adhesin [Salmonella enterica]|uniref:putative adhesin n=1 Tax=Salmonella enterica TaxID=28901 RepID=UPI0030145345
MTCHGYGCNQRNFVKPAGVSLKFIVPENTLAMVEDGEVIRKVAEGGIEYRDPDEQICDAGSTRTVKDYLLEAVTGNHYTRMTHNADWLAFYIKQLKDTGKPVNVMTLNPNAAGIHLTDVIQGLNDTFRQVPGLICGHCRPENASATVQKV